MTLATILLAAIPAFAHLLLADAQSRVVANSVEVQTALATVRQKNAALQLTRAMGIPHLFGDYSLSPQASANNTYSVEQHLITVGADLSINDLLAAAPQTRAAAADLLAAQRDAGAAILRARVTATRLYFAALQAIATQAVREADVSGAQRDRHAARLRYRTGEAPQIDIVRADVTLAHAQAALVRAQADRADAVDALASATAVPRDSLATLGGTVATTAPPLDEARATQRALALRPELTSLLATIEARSADVTAARQSGIPAATISGGYARGVDSELPVQGPSVAAHLDIRLASGAGARTYSAEAQVDIARAQLLDERRTIALQVSSAVRDARAQTAALRGANAARNEAARALSAVQTGYREGASSSLDVAIARSTYEQAALDALVAQYQQAQSLATLEVIVP